MYFFYSQATLQGILLAGCFLFISRSKVRLYRKHRPLFSRYVLSTSNANDNDYGNENDKKAKSVKVASWPYSNADTWLWCQKSLQDYLHKIRLNVEKTINVKKILRLKRKLRLAGIRILFSGIPLQRSKQLSLQANWKLLIKLARTIPGII